MSAFGIKSLGEAGVGCQHEVTVVAARPAGSGIVEETRVGPFAAIVPEVTGSAHIMGINQSFIDPDDPHWKGFLLG